MDIAAVIPAQEPAFSPHHSMCTIKATVNTAKKADNVSVLWEQLWPRGLPRGPTRVHGACLEDHWSREWWSPRRLNWPQQWGAPGPWGARVIRCSFEKSSIGHNVEMLGRDGWWVNAGKPIGSPLRSSGWKMMRVSRRAEEVGGGKAWESCVRAALLWILYPDLSLITGQVIRAINYKLIFFFFKAREESVAREFFLCTVCIWWLRFSSAKVNETIKPLPIFPHPDLKQC